MSAEFEPYNNNQHTRSEEEEYSPLRVWLHPVRTSRKILGTLESLRKRIDTMEMTETEAERLRTENRDLTSRLAESENARMELESQLAQMKDDEAYHEEMDRQLEQIEREFQKVEAMKKRYEATIATLREKLRGADDELRRLSGQRRDAIPLYEDYGPAYSQNNTSGSEAATPDNAATTATTNTEAAARDNAATTATTNTEAAAPRPDKGKDLYRRRLLEERARRYRENLIEKEGKEDNDRKREISTRPVVADGRGIPTQEFPAGEIPEDENDSPDTPVSRKIAVGNTFAPRRIDGTEWIGGAGR